MGVMPVLSSFPRRTAQLFQRSARHPTLDGAVNKRFLSTGETGELVRGNVGFGLNPGV